MSPADLQTRPQAGLLRLRWTAPQMKPRRRSCPSRRLAESRRREYRIPDWPGAVAGPRPTGSCALRLPAAQRRQYPARQLGVDNLGQTAVGDEMAVGIRGGCEAIGYPDAGGGEVSDHLAQRCVLAADLVEIGEAEVGEPDDCRRS